MRRRALEVLRRWRVRTVRPKPETEPEPESEPALKLGSQPKPWPGPTPGQASLRGKQRPISASASSSQRSSSSASTPGSSTPACRARSSPAASTPRPTRCASRRRSGSTWARRASTPRRWCWPCRLRWRALRTRERPPAPRRRCALERLARERRIPALMHRLPPRRPGQRISAPLAPAPIPHRSATSRSTPACAASTRVRWRRPHPPHA